MLRGSKYEKYKRQFILTRYLALIIKTTSADASKVEVFNNSDQAVLSGDILGDFASFDISD